MINIHHSSEPIPPGLRNLRLRSLIGWSDVVFMNVHGQAAAPVDAILREPPCRAEWHRGQAGERKLVN